MSERELNEAGLFIESYGGGFMIADYRDSDNARFCGSDFLWRRQPITYVPFVDRANAIEAAAMSIQ